MFNPISLSLMEYLLDSLQKIVHEYETPKDKAEKFGKLKRKVASNIGEINEA